jgi:ribonuclease HI
VRSSPRKLTAFIDGAARGNPGPAGAGAYFPPSDGRPEPLELFEALGKATNNEAEYRALLLALRAAREHGADELSLCADSELLVRQMNGDYRVRAENLKPLFAEAVRRAGELDRFSIRHVRREQNRDADRLANLGADVSERR